MRPIVYETAESLVDAAANRIAALAAEAIQGRGRFSIALAGGRTPLPVYERLARSPHAEAVDWHHVHVFWSDERCVPLGDSRSNARAATEAWLDRVGIPEAQIHRIEGEQPPFEGADAYETALREFLGPGGALDLILLGMGDDGHTASLFPRHQALQETQRWILPVHVPAEPPWRITMTLPIIHRARHRLFMVTGASKAEALQHVITGAPLPAGLASHGPRMKSGSSTWFVDRAAASRLRC